MARVSILLIAVALVVGIVSWLSAPSYDLTIARWVGGSVTSPGEGTFTYSPGKAVSLVAEAEEGYRFVSWSGDVGTIANVLTAETTIIMSGNYSITANFAPEIPEIPEIPENLEIRDWYDLDAVRDNPSNNHTLMNDLESTTAGYEELASPTANHGKGWEPIGGRWDDRFAGLFNGQGYEIKNLFIDRPDDESYVGLFGCIHRRGVVMNLGVVNADVTGYSGVDGLREGKGVGTLSISRGSWTGGLAGSNSGTVRNSYYKGSVTGEADVGGLVGENTGTVTNCYSIGSVTSNYRVGGLVGTNEGTVSNSLHRGSVTGDAKVGGLVGLNKEGIVSNSSSIGSVTGYRSVGGLVGWHYQGRVSNSYFIGSVFGNSRVGGLVGGNEGAVVESHFIGIVNGCLRIGGIVGSYVPCALFIDTTSGGSVTVPGEKAFTYDQGTVVNLVAEPDEGCRFVGWTGDVDTIANVDAASTTIAMNDNYLITANFGIEIRDWNDLDDIRDNLDGHHTLMNDLDSSTAGYEELASPTANEGKGWEPIFTDDEGFVGNFDGQGYEIRDLFINRPDEVFAGLFGVVEWRGRIEDIGVANADVTGGDATGGLVGFNVEGTVSNSYFTGTVTGGWRVGGLVGFNGGTVSHSYSTCNVTGGSDVGGLAGLNRAGIVSNSYSAGSVTGEELVGGLVGVNGGPVGVNDGTVSNSYSTSSVTGDERVGGLVGLNEGGPVNNSFWDTETSGQATSDGGTGKTTEEMQDIATFSGAGWNIIAVANPGTRNPSFTWNIVNGVTYPSLSWQA